MIAPRLGAYYATWTLPCVFWSRRRPSSPGTRSRRARRFWWSAPPSIRRTPTPGRWTWPARLESGVLLRREGTGHSSYWNSACVADVVNTYLRRPNLAAPRI